jgi:uncharacterized membrane protein HdeD (DUF308 family)
MSTDTQTSAAAAQKTWWVVLLAGIVSLVIGVLFVAWPGKTLVVLGVLFAIYLLLSGIFQLVRGFSKGLSGGYRALLFIGGALSLILGVWMLRLAGDNKLAEIWVIALFVGISFIFSGVGALFAAGESKDGQGWAIFTGVVYLLGGIVLIVWPATVAIFVWVAGIWLIVLGIFEIISSFMVRSAAKKAA